MVICGVATRIGTHIVEESILDAAAAAQESGPWSAWEREECPLEPT
jgi:hypothetical protein